MRQAREFLIDGCVIDISNSEIGPVQELFSKLSKESLGGQFIQSLDKMGLWSGQTVKIGDDDYLIVQRIQQLIDKFKLTTLTNQEAAIQKLNQLLALHRCVLLVNPSEIYKQNTNNKRALQLLDNVCPLTLKILLALPGLSLEKVEDTKPMDWRDLTELSTCYNNFLLTQPNEGTTAVIQYFQDRNIIMEGGAGLDSIYFDTTQKLYSKTSDGMSLFNRERPIVKQPFIQSDQGNQKVDQEALGILFRYAYLMHLFSRHDNACVLELDQRFMQLPNIKHLAHLPKHFLDTPGHVTLLNLLATSLSETHLQEFLTALLKQLDERGESSSASITLLFYTQIDQLYKQEILAKEHHSELHSLLQKSPLFQLQQKKDQLHPLVADSLLEEIEKGFFVDLSLMDHNIDKLEAGLPLSWLRLYPKLCNALSVEQISSLLAECEGQDDIFTFENPVLQEIILNNPETLCCLCCSIGEHPEYLKVFENSTAKNVLLNFFLRRRNDPGMAIHTAMSAIREHLAPHQQLSLLFEPCYQRTSKEVKIVCWAELLKQDPSATLSDWAFIFENTDDQNAQQCMQLFQEQQKIPSGALVPYLCQKSPDSLALLNLQAFVNTLQDSEVVFLVHHQESMRNDTLLNRLKKIMNSYQRDSDRIASNPALQAVREGRHLSLDKVYQKFRQAIMQYAKEHHYTKASSGNQTASSSAFTNMDRFKAIKRLMPLLKDPSAFDVKKTHWLSFLEPLLHVIGEAAFQEQSGMSVNNSVSHQFFHSIVQRGIPHLKTLINSFVQQYSDSNNFYQQLNTDPALLAELLMDDTLCSKLTAVDLQCIYFYLSDENRQLFMKIFVEYRLGSGFSPFLHIGHTTSSSSANPSSDFQSAPAPGEIVTLEKVGAGPPHSLSKSQTIPDHLRKAGGRPEEQQIAPPTSDSEIKQYKEFYYNLSESDVAVGNQILFEEYQPVIANPIILNQNSSSDSPSDLAHKIRFYMLLNPIVVMPVIYDKKGCPLPPIAYQEIFKAKEASGGNSSSSNSGEEHYAALLLEYDVTEEQAKKIGHNYIAFNYSRTQLQSLLRSYAAESNTPPLIFEGIINTDNNHYVSFWIYKHKNGLLSIFVADPTAPAHFDAELQYRKKFQAIFTDIFPGASVQVFNLAQQLQEHDCGYNCLRNRAAVFEAATTDQPVIEITRDDQIIFHVDRLPRYQAAGVEFKSGDLLYPRDVENSSIKNRESWAEKLRKRDKEYIIEYSPLVSDQPITVDTPQRKADCPYSYEKNVEEYQLACTEGSALSTISAVIVSIEEQIIQPIKEPFINSMDRIDPETLDSITGKVQETLHLYGHVAQQKDENIVIEKLPEGMGVIEGNEEKAVLKPLVEQSIKILLAEHVAQAFQNQVNHTIQSLSPLNDGVFIDESAQETIDHLISQPKIQYWLNTKPSALVNKWVADAKRKIRIAFAAQRIQCILKDHVADWLAPDPCPSDDFSSHALKNRVKQLFAQRDDPCTKEAYTIWTDTQDEEHKARLDRCLDEWIVDTVIKPLLEDLMQYLQQQIEDPAVFPMEQLSQVLDGQQEQSIQCILDQLIAAGESGKSKFLAYMKNPSVVDYLKCQKQILHFVRRAYWIACDRTADAAIRGMSASFDSYFPKSDTEKENNTEDETHLASLEAAKSALLNQEGQGLTQEDIAHIKEQLPSALSEPELRQQLKTKCFEQLLLKRVAESPQSELRRYVTFKYDDKGLQFELNYLGQFLVEYVAQGFRFQKSARTFFLMDWQVGLPRMQKENLNANSAHSDVLQRYVRHLKYQELLPDANNPSDTPFRNALDKKLTALQNAHQKARSLLKECKRVLTYLQVTENPEKLALSLQEIGNNNEFTCSRSKLAGVATQVENALKAPSLGAFHQFSESRLAELCSSAEEHKQKIITLLLIDHIKTDNLEPYRKDPLQLACGIAQIKLSDEDLEKSLKDLYQTLNSENQAAVKCAETEAKKGRAEWCVVLSIPEEGPATQSTTPQHISGKLINDYLKPLLVTYTVDWVQSGDCEFLNPKTADKTGLFRKKDDWHRANDRVISSPIKNVNKLLFCMQCLLDDITETIMDMEQPITVEQTRVLHMAIQEYEQAEQTSSQSASVVPDARIQKMLATFKTILEKEASQQKNNMKRPRQ